MSETEVTFPTRSRELHNALMDSDRWDSFKFRDNDIIIDTWAKSGTTWTQQIVGQLVFNGEAGLPVMDIAPWFDMRCFPLEEVMELVEGQTHRRFVKSHLPADALLISPKAKYIFLARAGKDVAWSFYNHIRNMTDEFFDMINDVPGRVGPTIDRPPEGVHDFFHGFLDHGGFYDWSYWEHIQSWWDIRETPNVQIFHFNELKADLPGSIRRMAEFLEIEIDEARFPDIVEHCTFDYMKEHADELSGMLEMGWEGGGRTFIHRGTNERWRDVLTAEDHEKYDSIVNANLTPDCARWHETGKMPD
jgi:aryl sulfotransferase